MIEYQILVSQIDNAVHDYVIRWKYVPRYWPFVCEFTDHRRIPLTKASDAELWFFPWSASEQTAK